MLKKFLKVFGKNLLQILYIGVAMVGGLGFFVLMWELFHPVVALIGIIFVIALFGTFFFDKDEWKR